MQVTIDIPDSLAEQLTAAGKDPARETLEAILVEGYRIGLLSSGEIKRALGYGTRMQVHQLLKDHNVPLDYGIEQLMEDRRTMLELEKRLVSSAA